MFWIVDFDDVCIACATEDDGYCSITEDDGYCSITATLPFTLVRSTIMLLKGAVLTTIL